MVICLHVQLIKPLGHSTFRRVDLYSKKISQSSVNDNLQMWLFAVLIG